MKASILASAVLLGAVLLALSMPTEAAVPPGDGAQPTITVTDQTKDRIFQRASGTKAKSIVFSGAYTGPAPHSIEVEIVNAADGAVRQGFTALASARIGGGVWSGALSVPQGGMYRFIARGKDAAGTELARSPQSANLWGVGIVIGLLGQSNILYWENAASPPAADSRVREYGRPGVGGGPWQGLTGNGDIAFADAVRTGIEAAGGGIVPVGIVNDAQGGSSSYQWVGLGIAGGYYAKPWAADLAAIGGDVEMVIWYQGESDAGGGGVNFASSVNTLYGYLQTNTGRTAAQLPFIEIVLGTVGSDYSDAAWNGFQRAQLSWRAMTSGAYLGGWQADLARADQFHMSPANYQIAASRDALTVLKILGDARYSGKGPEISGGSFVPGSSVLTVTIAHEGGTGLVADRRTDGGHLNAWRVFDNGAPMKIASTAFVQPNKVRLTLSAPLAHGHAIAFDYMYGANPNSAADGASGGPDGLVFDNSKAVAGGLPLLMSNGPIAATEAVGR